MQRQLIYRPSAKPSIPVILPVRSTGYYKIGRDSKEHTMVKNFIQFFWCVKGRGQFIIDGQEYFLEPEHCCIYFPGDCHRLAAVSTEWEYYWFTTDPLDADSLIKEMQLRKAPFYAGKCPENLFLELQNELRDFSSSGQYRASATGYDILIRALSGGFKTEPHGMVEEFKTLVEENFHRPEISVSIMADMLNVHRSTLNRIFTAQTGMSPGNYLNSYRIQEALSMLKGTGMRIAEVSEKAGFSDPNYFSKAIKKTTGFTPLEFRNR